MNTDNLIKIIVTLLILGYIGIGIYKEFNLSNLKNNINDIKKDDDVLLIEHYIDTHYNFTRQDGLTFCFAKQDVINYYKTDFNKITDDYIKATYKDSNYIIEYVSICN